MDDFEVYQRRDMDFLIKRGVVKIAENGRLVINQQRAYVLYELYKNTLICYSYCDDQIKRIIDELVLTDEMEFSNNSLFSKPEYHYLNYMLNKHEYSNGCDLRNKYVHGSSPTDESTITTDYYELMKITAFIIIKINEEFCLKYNHTGNE